MIEQLIVETPHVEYTKGKFVDLKRETGDIMWIMDFLPKIFKKNKSKFQEISKNLIDNMGFVNIFKMDYKMLRPEMQDKLRKKLPKVFWELLNKRLNYAI